MKNENSGAQKLVYILLVVLAILVGMLIYPYIAPEKGDNEMEIAEEMDDLYNMEVISIDDWEGEKGDEDEAILVQDIIREEKWAVDLAPSEEKYTAEMTQPIEEQRVYESVEMMPQYPGGEKAMREFIASNLRYPVVAQESGIEGRVVIRFVVETNGSITEITVIRGLDKACDLEASRVIGLMPKWIPGKQNGKNVAVYFTIPIIFKLTH